jgi:hypothetical protein
MPFTGEVIVVEPRSNSARTETTGLTVPVAVTMALMGPRSTGMVVYLTGGGPAVHQYHSPIPPAAATIAIPISQDRRVRFGRAGSVIVAAGGFRSWADESLDEWRAGIEEDPGGMISVTGIS